MPKWLHNMFSKVSNTITAANNVRAENGQPAFPYHWLELEFGDNALIAVKTGSDSSFPADGVNMVERVRDLMNAGALGQDIACVRIPSRASYEAQLAAAEQAQAEAVVAAEQGDSAGQVAEQAELASVTAEQVVDVAGTAAEEQADSADPAEPVFAIPELPAFDVDYGTWGIEYADGSVREFNVAAGAFS